MYKEPEGCCLHVFAHLAVVVIALWSLRLTAGNNLYAENHF